MDHIFRYNVYTQFIAYEYIFQDMSILIIELSVIGILEVISELSFCASGIEFSVLSKFSEDLITFSGEQSLF